MMTALASVGTLAQQASRFSPTALLWLGLVGSVLLLLFFGLIIVVRYYKRCPSNRILVIFGKVGGNRASKCLHGGGAFILHHDGKTQALTAYDGRETAPAGATENYLRWVSDTQAKQIEKLALPGIGIQPDRKSVV